MNKCDCRVCIYSQAPGPITRAIQSLEEYRKSIPALIKQYKKDHPYWKNKVWISAFEEYKNKLYERAVCTCASRYVSKQIDELHLRVSKLEAKASD